MTRARRPHHSQKPPMSEQACSRIGAATVASLGIRARLIPASSNGDGDLANLIIACQIPRAEQECLFQRIVKVLAGRARHGGVFDRPSYRSSKE